MSVARTGSRVVRVRRTRPAPRARRGGRRGERPAQPWQKTTRAAGACTGGVHSGAAAREHRDRAVADQPPETVAAKLAPGEPARVGGGREQAAVQRDVADVRAAAGARRRRRRPVAAVQAPASRSARRAAAFGPRRRVAARPLALRGLGVQYGRRCRRWTSGMKHRDLEQPARRRVADRVVGAVAAIRGGSRSIGTRRPAATRTSTAATNASQRKARDREGDERRDARGRQPASAVRAPAGSAAAGSACQSVE